MRRITSPLRRTTGATPFLRCVLAAGAVFALAAERAAAESDYCRDLRAQIARAGEGSERYAGALDRQQYELNRTLVYARRLGCDRQQFLFFGAPPPPQCAQINARIGQMRANLAALQQRSDEGRRSVLLARYDAQCRETPPPRNFLDELFNLGPPQGGAIRGPFEENPDPFNENPRRAGDGEVGGGEAVCVRQCDGGFFPLSYSARRSDLDELNALCKALCPNAEAALYTKSLWRDIDSAVSIDGDSYANHPNALKFQKTRVPQCGCKPQGVSWADALADAERILAASHSKDTVVTAEQAEQLSRPAPATDGRRRDEAKGQKSDAKNSDPTSGASTKEQGVIRETVGPDGAARRVRVIAPSL